MITGARGEDEGNSAAEIAKELANPNTPLSSLNFKHQFRFYDGDLPGAGDEWNYSLIFQPTFPFKLKNDDLLIWRPAIPFVVESPVPFVSRLPATGLEDLEIDFDGETGLGDIGFDLAYAKTTDTGFLSAIGLFTSLPTATSDLLGTGRWAIGPELLIGKQTDTAVFGLFPNHIWDIAGWGDNTINVTTIQAFATLLPGGGWNIGTAPIMTYNWENEQWTIPINLNVGKTVVLGGTPWKIGLEANYYVERPGAFAAEWMVGINISPVIKNPLARLFGAD